MRVIEKVALDQCVLAVAVVNFTGNGLKSLRDWAVYIGPVSGINHEKEAEGVAARGSKQRKEIAAVLFSGIDIERYRR